ncbi:MAG: hypothetical protein LBP59_06135 [Planctomycetaceae bacterium]|jgi:hypothetical protein|nr:hypothetical protein [Planctomycetaceae bacterium]
MTKPDNNDNEKRVYEYPTNRLYEIITDDSWKIAYGFPRSERPKYTTSFLDYMLCSFLCIAINLIFAFIMFSISVVLIAFVVAGIINLFS